MKLIGAFTIMLITTMISFVAYSAQRGQCPSDEVYFGGHFGPWDYFDPKNWEPSVTSPPNRIEMVTKIHFTRDTRALQHPRTAGNLHYTLRSIPNHPDALTAMLEYQKRFDSPMRTPWHKYRKAMPLASVCYFQYAANFTPNNYQIWFLWGISLHREKQYVEAVDMYLKADKLSPENIEIQYNLGLVYFKLGQYEESRKWAKLAYQKDIQLFGLKNLLKSKGEWQDD